MSKKTKIETSFGLSVEVGAAELADLQRQGLVKESKAKASASGAQGAADNAAKAAEQEGASI